MLDDHGLVVTRRHVPIMVVMFLYDNRFFGLCRTDIRDGNGQGGERRLRKHRPEHAHVS